MQISLKKIQNSSNFEKIFIFIVIRNAAEKLNTKFQCISVQTMKVNLNTFSSVTVFKVK